MKSYDDKIVHSQIIMACERIIEYCGTLDLDTFEQDYKTQDAVIRQLEIVGEATKRLSRGFRNTNNKIPWKSMAGMRDILIHNYENPDMQIIWLTASKSVPELLAKLREVEIS